MKPHLKHTLSKWSELLTTIPDLHTRAWAASIIYWDYSTTPAWNALQSHIVGYQSARELRADTASIIAALTSIGYERAESRCTLCRIRWAISPCAGTGRPRSVRERR